MQQLMNFIFGADVVVAQSEYGTTMLFDNSVTLPNSKIFCSSNKCYLCDCISNIYEKI
jgi:branched-chain amino acid transport system permease protein